MNRFGFFFLTLGAAVGGCSDANGGSGEPPAGMIDALSEAACDSTSESADSINSVLDADDAIANALVHAEEPTIVTLAGPVSYVALDLPSPHTDYGLFAQPEGSVTATSTTNLSEEYQNASCPDDAMGELRIHIHEFEHTVLTLEGEGDVWLYFGAAGDPGHGGAGGHGHGGEGGHGHGGEGGHAHGGEGGHGHDGEGGHGHGGEPHG